MSELKVAAELSLPEDAVTSTIVVFGGKGMGKTNFGAVLVEELTAARLRWVVLDGLGVWWGLRHSADGGRKGIPCLILGGTNGDIPIEPTGGDIVADLIVDEDVDVIVDFSRRPDGRMWSKGEKMRFVTDFARRIYMRQGELVDNTRRPPLHIVLDEAARYIPQLIRAGDKEAALSVSAWEDLVEEGRNVGIGVSLLTQRSARINKSVSELADSLFAFRTVGPLSIGAITDWLGDHVPKERIREHIERIRSLPVGSALVVSPGWLQFEDVVHVRARETFDSSATPKAGETRRVTGPAAKPDLAKYQERMAETAARIDAEDPRKLKTRLDAQARQIVQLEGQLATRATPAVAVDREQQRLVQRLTKALEMAMNFIIRVNVPQSDEGWSDEEKQALERAVSGAVASATKILEQRLASRQHEFTAIRRDAERVLRHLKAAVEGDITVDVDVRHQEPFTVAPAPALAPRPAPAPRPVAPILDGDVKLGLAARKVLGALAQYPQGRSHVQLAMLTGYAHNGGGFNNALGQLRSSGYVEGKKDLITITEAGMASAGDVEPLPRGRELYDHWMKQLSKAERAILEQLIERPDGMSKDELGTATGYTPNGGGFNNALGRLRTLELITREPNPRPNPDLLDALA